jgi:hypothetical protein
MKNKTDKNKDLIEKIFCLEMEKQVRCGSGNGRQINHSLNCRCQFINKEIKELRILYENKMIII